MLPSVCVRTTMVRSPPGASAAESMALTRRFNTTCSSWTRSPLTITGSGARSSATTTLRITASLLKSLLTPRIRSLRSRSVSRRSPFRSMSRRRWITSAARRSSAMMSARMFRSSTMSSGATSRNRRAAWALVMIPVSGWRSSCASEAVSSPIVETRVKCASSWRLRSACTSARFRSVTSVCETTAPPSGRFNGTTDSANHRSPVGAGVFEGKSPPGAVEDLLDLREHFRRARRALACDLGASLEIVRPQGDASVCRHLVFAAESAPSVVDGDDPACAIQDGDAAAQGGEDGGLHQLARAQGILGFLARQRVGEDLAHQLQPLHLLLRPGPLDRHGIERQATQHPSAGHEGNGEARAEASMSERGLVRGRLMAEALPAGEDQRLLAEQPLDRPRQVTGNDDRWYELDSGSDPRV